MTLSERPVIDADAAAAAATVVGVVDVGVLALVVAITDEEAEPDAVVTTELPAS